MSSKVQLNEPVPQFKFTATSGFNSDLKALKGRVIVLYFYPKDNTPGCTTEAQNFRDFAKDFNLANTVILGVSRDSLSSHEKFKTKYQLPFELISDEDEKLCKLFDVLKLKNSFGKQHIGVVRSTFIIDSEGILRAEWRNLNVSGHVEEVVEFVKSLK